MGHGLSGEANKPWYAKSGSILQSEEAAALQVDPQLHSWLRGLQHLAGDIRRVVPTFATCFSSAQPPAVLLTWPVPAGSWWESISWTAARCYDSRPAHLRTRVALCRAQLAFTVMAQLSQDKFALQGSAAPAVASQQHRTQMLEHSASQAALLGTSQLSEKKQRSAEKAARKEAKRRKHAEKAAQKQKHRLKTGLDLERLRRERRVREKAEHERARQAVLGNARAKGVIGDGKRYNSAYGNAAAREAATV